MTLSVSAPLKDRVLALLERHYGRENAVKGMELARALGLRDDRAVQQAILELIAGGVPVCSSCRAPMGYFLPAAKEEAAEYYEQLTGRALENFIRRRKFKKAFQGWFYGQPQRRLL